MTDLYARIWALGWAAGCGTSIAVYLYWGALGIYWRLFDEQLDLSAIDHFNKRHD